MLQLKPKLIHTFNRRRVVTKHSLSLVPVVVNDNFTTRPTLTSNHLQLHESAQLQMQL